MKIDDKLMKKEIIFQCNEFFQNFVNKNVNEKFSGSKIRHVFYSATKNKFIGFIGGEIEFSRFHQTNLVDAGHVFGGSNSKIQIWLHQPFGIHSKRGKFPQKSHKY